MTYFKFKGYIKPGAGGAATDFSVIGRNEGEAMEKLRKAFPNYSGRKAHITKIEELEYM